MTPWTGRSRLRSRRLRVGVRFKRAVRWTLPSSVHISSMPDANNAHHRFIFEHTVDDAVVANAGSTKACELALEHAADALRILEQRAGHELDNCERRSRRESLE